MKIQQKEKEESKLPLNATELSDEIRKIGAAFDALAKTKLKQRVLLLLIADITGLSTSTIQRVLDALPRLETEFLKSK